MRGPSSTYRGVMSFDTRAGALPHHEIAWLGPPQPDNPQVATLVLLHGYGSNEKDLISLVPAMQMFLPGVSAKVIAVRASHQAPGRPRGYSWFPGSVMAQPSDAAIGQTADRVAALIRQHTSKAVVLGFSQGMCTAITVLRRHPDLVGGLVALSGFMFDDDHPGDSQLAVGAATGSGVPAFAGYDPARPDRAGRRQPLGADLPAHPHRPGGTHLPADGAQRLDGRDLRPHQVPPKGPGGALSVAPLRHRGAGAYADSMAKYTVNQDAVAKARQLIDARQYVLDSDWGDVQPKADDENEYLKSHSFQEYARLASRAHRGRQRGDQGPLRLRLRRPSPGAPHRAHRLRLPGVGVAAQGRRTGRPRLLQYLDAATA